MSKNFVVNSRLKNDFEKAKMFILLVYLFNYFISFAEV
jgi:hypothetical protein